MKKFNNWKKALLGKTLLLLFTLTGIGLAGAQAQTNCAKADFDFAVDNNTKTVKFESKTSSNVVSIKWDFGNGKTAWGKNAVQKYDSAGTYKVCLTAYAYINVSGTRTKCSTTVCKRVTILDCTLKTEFASRTDDLSVKLEAKSNSRNAVYSWVFGDGNRARGQAVKHTFKKGGTYYVCVIAKDTVTGCIARSCEKVTVKDWCNLEIGFELAQDGKSIKVEAKSNSRNAVYGWTFGDSTAVRGKSAKHTYSSYGKYTVCLLVKDTVTGCTARKCRDIVVKKPCNLKVEFASTNRGNTFHFAARSTDTSARYVWNFGDGNRGTGQKVSHTYKKPGTYEVCVTAYTGKTTTGGKVAYRCVAKACKKITIKPDNDCKLKGDFRYAINGKGIKVSGSANEKGVLYFWSWGDGTSEHGQTAKHRYKKPGTYEVCLIIFNPRTKCKVCICKKVVISKPCNLRANFGYRVDSNVVAFRARSNSKNVVYGWSFGDGNAKRGQTVRHKYAKPGKYKVTLTAKDTVTGCLITQVKYIIINPKVKRSLMMPMKQASLVNDNGNTSSVNELTAPENNWTAKVYPSPSDTRVAFTADKPLTSVNVFNASGHKVLTSDLVETKDLDISTLPTGYYFAHLQAQDGSVKIVKFVRN